MKKLLLVLLVVALASFLLVGCLGEGTVVDDGDEDENDDGDVAVEVTLEVENDYLDPLTGKTYVNGLDDCLQDVIVTIPGGVDAIETYEDSVVYVAVKWYDETNDKDVFVNLQEATSTDGIVWTAEDYDFCGIVELDGATLIDNCESICLVALVKHPCCPGDEIVLKVVTVDGADPYADLFVTVEDCADECDPDPCATDGVYLTWTSTTAATSCLPADDCCGDDCSGLASWTIEVEPDACAGPCDLVTGSCPVVGTLDCGCLPYADSGETVTYTVKYTLLDNVGNEFTEDWTIELGEDSGEDITVVAGDFSGTVTLDTAFTVYDGACD